MLERCSGLAYKLAYWACFVIFAAMLFSIMLQVFCRYALGRPLLWPEELTRFAMAWLAFLGASIGVKKGSHVAYTLVSQYLPTDFVRFFVPICFCIFSVMGIISGMNIVLGSSGTSPVLNISFNWSKLGMIVGLVFMFVHGINFCYSEFLSLLSSRMGGNTRQIGR